MKTTGMGPAVLGTNWPATRTYYGYPDEGGVGTVYAGPRTFSGQSGNKPAPIGVMFAALLGALAYEDSDLRPIADYFRRAGMFGAGAGTPRIWPWTVYSDEVRRHAIAGELSSGEHWDEWALTIL